MHFLNSWEEQKPGSIAGSNHGLAREDNSAVTHGVKDSAHCPLARGIVIMFCCYTTLFVRNPVLYFGCCMIFLVANLVFGFVYWNGRAYTQDQATNKLWVAIWFVGVPTNIGVVAVYTLNDKFKSILSKTKNKMVSALSYILAKTVLVIPIMFVFALFALGIPGFLIQDFEGSAFGCAIAIWLVLLYSFECATEFCVVLFDNPILGMMQFMNLWFASFLLVVL